MIKRIVAVATLICAPAAMTYAAVWQLQTQNSNVGGTIRVRSVSAAAQTGTTAVFNYYTTHANVPVYITPSTGYTISSLKVNGVATTISSPQQMGLTVYPTKSAQSLVVGYTQQKISVSAVAGPGGSVSPSGASTVTYGSSKTFTFTPAAGNSVVGISNLPAGAVVSPAVPAAIGTPVSVTVNNITDTFAMTGNFTALVASAGNPQYVMNNGATVTLHGSATVSAGGTPSYSWVQTAGPATLTLSGANTATPTFAAPATLGLYTFKLTAANGSGSSTATTKVTVTDSPASVAQASCQDCHTASNVSPADVFTKWQSSRHNNSNKPVICATCHAGADTGSHPGATVTASTCESCHSAGLSTTTHPVAVTSSKCITCHDPHNPASGIADLQPTNHPAVTLYTFEELGMQMAGGQKMPVQVDANGNGFPYSPKQTCGTAGCHVKGGVDYTYDKISDHAFHSAEGRNEYVDSANGKFDATKTKPWTQSTAMVGKW